MAEENAIFTFPRGGKKAKPVAEVALKLGISAEELLEMSCNELQARFARMIFSILLVPRERPVGHGETTIRELLANHQLVISLQKTSAPRRGTSQAERHAQLVEEVRTQHTGLRRELLDVVTTKLTQFRNELARVQTNLGTEVTREPSPQSQPSPAQSRAQQHGGTAPSTSTSSSTLNENETQEQANVSQQRVWINTAGNSIGQAFIQLAVVQVIREIQRRPGLGNAEDLEAVKQLALEELPEFFQTRLKMRPPLAEIEAALAQLSELSPGGGEGEGEGEGRGGGECEGNPRLREMLDSLHQFLEDKRQQALSEAIHKLGEQCSDIVAMVTTLVEAQDAKASPSKRDNTSTDENFEGSPRKKQKQLHLPSTPHSQEDFWCLSPIGDHAVALNAKSLPTAPHGCSSDQRSNQQEDLLTASLDEENGEPGGIDSSRVFTKPPAPEGVVQAEHEEGTGHTTKIL